MKEKIVLTPPLEWDESADDKIGGKSPVRIFLAGTIDNGNSDNWQEKLIKTVNSVPTRREVVFYNPRRSEWPSSDNHREIDKQINWELYHLEKCDRIVMNILGDSKSPISLMEIGLFAREDKLLVFCPETFYRYDNVRVVCEKYKIPLFTTNDIQFIAQKVCNYVGIDEEMVLRRNH